jgi:hypothetical protein
VPLLEKIASLGIGEVCKGIGSLAKDIRTAITGDISPEKKAELETKVLELEALSQQLDVKNQELRSNVIIAEAQGGSSLQRNWRPMLMLTFGVIIANNYIIAPYLSALFGFSVTLEIPPDMWGLLKLGVGGYIVGRSAEKSIRMWKERE